MFSLESLMLFLQALTLFFFRSSAFSAFVDVYLAVYPAVVLFGLQMSLKKKVVLSSALGIGSMYVPHHPYLLGFPFT